MRITGITVHVLGPEAESFPSEALVRIMTDEGIEGNCLIDSVYAEELVRRFAAGSSAYLADAWNVGKGTLEKLVGADPLDRERIEKSWSSQYFWSPMNNSISCVLNECLWDIAGKALKLPVYKVLGANREKVLAYASTQFYEDEKDYLDIAVKLKEAGYRAIKLHPHRDWERDIQLCRRVREIVGDKMILMLDPLNAYTRDQALKVGREIEKLDFYWYEDPIPPTDVSGLVDLCRSLDIRILMGEHTRDMRDYGEYLRRGAADALRCWDVNVGGITPMFKIATLAESFTMNCEIVSWGNPLRQAAGLHTILAVRNCDFFELPVPEGIFDRGFKDRIRIDDEGYVRAPSKPGLGIEVEWEAIKSETARTISYPK